MSGVIAGNRELLLTSGVIAKMEFLLMSNVVADVSDYC